MLMALQLLLAQGILGAFDTLDNPLGVCALLSRHTARALQARIRL